MDRVARTINGFFDEYGIWTVLTVPPLAALTILGAVVSLPKYRVIVGAALFIFWAIVLFALLLYRLRELAEQARSRSDIINKYSARILAADGRKFRQESIEFTYVYSAHGDAVVEQRTNILVDGPLELTLIEQDMGAVQPVNKRNRVRVEARQINPSGEPGARYDITTEWLSDRNIRTLIHLPNPIPAGQRVRIYTKWTWPRLSPDLLNSGKESFGWQHVQETDLLKVEILFDKSCRLKNEIAVSSFPATLATPTQTPVGGGFKLEWRCDKPPPKATVGFILDTAKSF